MPATVGANEEMEGIAWIVKIVPDAALVLPFVVTLKVPVIAPVGTVTTREVAVAEPGIAVTPPLKLTLLFKGVALKFVPEIVIVLPIPTIVGAKEEMVGKEGATTEATVTATITDLPA